MTIASTRTLWYVTRGTGTVALLLLTASVLMGIGVAVRWRGRNWPRFAVADAHRNLTLLSIGFVALHIVTTVADGFAPISLAAAVVPFSSPYRPLWLALGTISFDLLLALVATSLARRRVPARAWRLVHWLAYAAWPVALVHSFGTGSDARFGWFALLGFACLAVVAAAVLARALQARDPARVRAVAAAAALALPVAIVVWYRSGPAQTGWARRAGTPAAVLARAHPAAAAAVQASLVRRSPAVAAPPRSFVSAIAGTVAERPAAGGLVDVQIVLRLRGGPRGAARIDLRGEPTGGGVSMTASGVSFVPATTRAVYTGSVVALAGSRVEALVRDSAGQRLRLAFVLSIDAAGGSVNGIVAASSRAESE
ncbi:MAG TPA: ferric reductase-like transmembrane domain-containing protein [Gaiellaceae bacterium]|nr:ferric reductase-like transmembrane domain-containing protein [Gaiellaceae bacterium]